MAIFVESFSHLMYLVSQRLPTCYPTGNARNCCFWYISYTYLQRFDLQILQDDKRTATSVDLETKSDEDERKRENDVQYQHNQPTGKDAYTGEKTMGHVLLLCVGVVVKESMNLGV